MDPDQFRPAVRADEPFLFTLFCSVRAAMLAPAALGTDGLEPLLRMQYAGQRMSYARDYPGAEHSIVLQEGSPIGSLVVARTDSEIRLVDVALLPRHRGLGHGGAIVRWLQREALESGRPLCLTVAMDNAGARRLYERLGFEQVLNAPPYLEMVWRAPG